MQKPRVLIIGGSGQVGSYLHDIFSLQGNCHTAYSPNHRSKGLSLDLANEKDIRAKVQAVKPEIIINAGAYTAVDRAESEPEIAHRINAVGPAILAEEAAKTGALLIHFSTDYVFAGTGCKMWLETDEPSPINTYGRSKLAGEQAIASAHDHYLILRTSWVISPRGNNFVKTMLRLGCERDDLRVIDDQTGAPTSAENLAFLTANVVKQIWQLDPKARHRFTGVYHVASEGETTWHGLATSIFQRACERGMQLKVKNLDRISTKDYPTAAQRPLNSRLDCRKFKATFAMTPMAWQEAVNAIVDELVTPMYDESL